MTSNRGPSIPGELGHTPPNRAARREHPRSTFRRRRIAVALGALALAVGIIAVVGWPRDADEPPPLPPGAVRIDSWAPYWSLDDTLPVIDSRLDHLREVSPFWYSVSPGLEIVTDEHAPAEATERFTASVLSARTALVPSIRDELPAGDMATVLANPTLRAKHIELIVEFADDTDADGIDLDYEKFAFSDGRDTWEATRPNWVTFVEELATELHDRGLTLTVSIPPVYDAAVTGDRGYWVYDHGAIADHVDYIRIMTYDYSVGDAGPIAPLDWVQESIDGVSAAVAPEHHHKLVLGVPTYGNNWVVSTAGECPDSAEGRTNVTARTANELAARRGATPILDPLNLEWQFRYDLTVSDGITSCVQTREVRWVDAEGAAARVHLARAAGWGGVALWALGYEDDDAWAALTTAATEPLPPTPAS